MIDITMPIRVLLVDDQAMIGEAVRRMLLADPSIEFRYCASSAQAIARAIEFKPTVILQDLVMPEIDGLTMLANYRADAATREIPVIVLSTKEEPKTKAEAFTLGASDYLVKLPDPVELIARVVMHSRGYVAQLQRNQAYAALKRSEEHLAEELAEAARYLRSLLPAKIEKGTTADWEFIPCAELGGDTLGYEWLDEDHFSMYLLDVCGHGLKAALLSISAMNVMRNRTLPNTDFRSPASVLSGMNEAFQMDRHNFMYFTMWYSVYNRKTRQLSYANAGHPPAILLGGPSADAATMQVLTEHGLIVGAMPGVTYNEVSLDLPPFARLYFFSDGLFEVTRPDDTMMTFEEFAEKVGNLPRNKPALADILSAVRAERARDDFEDDLSIVEVTF